MEIAVTDLDVALLWSTHFLARRKLVPCFPPHSQPWQCTCVKSPLRRWRPEEQKFKVLFGHIRSLTLSWDTDGLITKPNQEALEESPVSAFLPQSPLVSARQDRSV